MSDPFKRFVSIMRGDFAGEVIAQNGQFYTVQLFDSVQLVGGGFAVKTDRIIEVLSDECDSFLSAESCVEFVLRELSRKAN